MTIFGNGRTARRRPGLSCQAAEGGRYSGSLERLARLFDSMRGAFPEGIQDRFFYSPQRNSVGIDYDQKIANGSTPDGRSVSAYPIWIWMRSSGDALIGLDVFIQSDFQQQLIGRLQISVDGDSAEIRTFGGELSRRTAGMLRPAVEDPVQFCIGKVVEQVCDYDPMVGRLIRRSLYGI